MRTNVNKILKQLKAQMRWFVIAMLPMVVMANPTTTDSSEWEAEIEAQIEQEKKTEPVDAETTQTTDSQSGPVIPCGIFPVC